MIGERPLWEIIDDGVHKPYLRCPLCTVLLCVILPALLFAILPGIIFGNLLAWILP